jgi:hypothetical protein
VADALDISAFRDYISAALQYASGTHTFEDIAEAVSRGEMQFWPGPHSAVVTEILSTPRKRIVNFFLAGGNLAELEAMEAPILAWAKEQGCTEALFIGRRGWERTFLTRKGWTSSGMVVLEKML